MSSSNSGFDYDYEDANQYGQVLLKEFKSLRENVNLEIEKERVYFILRLCPIVKNWYSELPNLRDIFCPEEIDCLLKDAVLCINEYQNYHKGERFIDFVARTGYIDEPKLDKDGKPLLNRTTPIHLAGRDKICSLVLTQLFKIYNRFDVNYVDELGMTHFHVACKCYSYIGAAEKFLKFGQDPNCHPPPLHEAMAGNNNFAIRLLLKHGADPNSADEDGSTPLHIIMNKEVGDKIDLLNTIFSISEEKRQFVKVNAQDKFGRTPLHYALMSKWNKIIVQLLLDRNANPNLADVDGLTPLHLICQRKFEEKDLVDPFFEMCDEKHQLVPVDPLDNRGRTPLHYAVMSLLPNTVGFLLNRGADLSKFVFPTESDFDDIFKKWFGYYYDCKLKLASGAMSIVENLEKRGYELDRSDAVMIMKWYAKYGLFENSEELEKYLYKDEEFVSKAKNQMICTGDEMKSPSLSLYDLIQLRPEEIEKLFTYWDYDHLEDTCWKWGLTDRVIQACVVHLCEMRSRRFFRRWAVYPFWDLIHQRLPLEVCEMVVEHLTNEDLYHICLAAQSQSS